MPDIRLTKKQARRFILLKQGLLGDYKFTGKEGILNYIHQVGCIQFDPIDVCGKNAELVLHSRVKGFTGQMLYDLLYKDRKLIDYFDKNLSILPAEDWQYFSRDRNDHRLWERSHAEIQSVREQIIKAISESGPVCSSDLDLPQKVDWYWSSTKLSRAALEHMYFTGDLAIHHKKGAVKYYDLIENCLPKEIITAPDPYPDDHDHRKWRVLRRIGALGLLWNRASDAWLGIGGLKSRERTGIFAELTADDRIIPVTVDGIGCPLYCLTEDIPAIDYIKTAPRLKQRCELIAPLDNMMWDRNLIRSLFDFDYKWEIYTPVSQRKYGCYVLPILYGEGFAGRVEAVYDKKAKKLNVKNLWYEPNVKPTEKIKTKITAALNRLEKFNAG